QQPRVRVGHGQQRRGDRQQPPGHRTRRQPTRHQPVGQNPDIVIPDKVCFSPDLASPTATSAAAPTATSYGWPGWSGPRTPDIRSPWRARNWDIDVEVNVDEVRDINRQPRIDVHGRRWRIFASNRSEVPVHARRARWRWWWLGAADRW